MTPYQGQGERLRGFVRESNRIEGILREPTEDEIAAHSEFLAAHALSVITVAKFVATVAEAPIRDKSGMDVRVGAHIPPPGGTHITRQLDDLICRIEDVPITPYEAHTEYERLHPFMDGNGRSGRVLWAWHMQQDGHDPFALPFLHRFYYQTLEATSP